MRYIRIKDTYWYRIGVDGLNDISPADQNYYFENQFEDFVTIDIIGNYIFIYGKDSVLNRLYVRKVSVDIAERLRKDNKTYSFWPCYALVDSWSNTWDLEKFIEEAKSNMNIREMLPSPTINGISASSSLELMEAIESLQLIFDPGTTLKEMSEAVNEAWSKTMICPSCKGRGKYNRDTLYCQRCDGTGYIYEHEDF